MCVFSSVELRPQKECVIRGDLGVIREVLIDETKKNPLTTAIWNIFFGLGPYALIRALRTQRDCVSHFGGFTFLKN